MNRRGFLTASGLAAGSMLITPALKAEKSISSVFPGTTNKKIRVVLVGAGSRGSTMFGKRIVENYSAQVEYVGICDLNEGRAQAVKEYMGVDCPVFTDHKKMFDTVKPEMVLVCTTDSEHDKIIVEGLNRNMRVVTEKPMTIDQYKCQSILDAERKSKGNLTVTFNYRYSPHRAKIWELLQSGVIGDITSVDFHWYLDVRHGADYFRRWHRLRDSSGSLWVHKATHHFDLLNWWLQDEPENVFAKGSLDFYGKNGTQGADCCRNCKKRCDFYWDITSGKSNQLYKMLYIDNQSYDGYLRDGCVFRPDVDIYDKMSAIITYTRGTVVNYSLTTYSPYEGYRIAFNGTKGRMDAWIQESKKTSDTDYDEIVVMPNFGKRNYIRVQHTGGGHGGGDTLLLNKIFLNEPGDPFKQAAGVRDGAFSILMGTAARMSCDTGKTIQIADLTDLKPGKLQ